MPAPETPAAAMAKEDGGDRDCRPALVESDDDDGEWRSSCREDVSSTAFMGTSWQWRGGGFGGCCMESMGGAIRRGTDAI